MTFDELQKNWQEQKSGFHVSIDPDMLLKEVKRNKESFKATIFWRDVREIGISIPLFIFFSYVGLKDDTWELILVAVGFLFVAAFMTIDRISQKRKRTTPDETLKGCVKGSLAEVKHQVWLLKNVLWWYLLPPGIGVVAISYGMVLSTIRNFRGDLLGVWVCLGVIAFFALIFIGVYWLNQYAVRKVLLPRKDELEQLLNAISNSND